MLKQEDGSFGVYCWRIAYKDGREMIVWRKYKPNVLAHGHNGCFIGEIESIRLYHTVELEKRESEKTGRWIS